MIHLFDFEKKRSEIYVENGTNIQINFNAKDYLNSLEFKGDYASFNNYLAKKAIANQGFFSKMDDIYTLEAEECKKELRNNYITPFLKSLDEVTDITETLRGLEKKNIQSGYLEKLKFFERYHVHFTKKENFKYR